MYVLEVCVYEVCMYWKYVSIHLIFHSLEISAIFLNTFPSLPLRFA